MGRFYNWRVTNKAGSSLQNINVNRNLTCAGVIQSCIRTDGNDKELRVNNETINKSRHELVNNKGRTCDSTSLGRLSRRISVRVVPISKTIKSIEDAPFLEVYGIVPVKGQRVSLIYSELIFSLQCILNIKCDLHNAII